MSRARTRPASILASLALAVAAAALAAPSGCARGTPCTFNSDCPVGYCEDGSCRQNCVDSARDCQPGYVCNANAQCVPSGTSSSSSGSTGASSSGSTGGGGTGGSQTTGGGGTGGSQSSSSGSTSTSSSSSSSSSSSGGADPPVGKDVGKPCSGTGQCSFGCLAFENNGTSGYCTASCNTGADCPNGWGCMAGPGGQRVCIQAAAYCGGGQACAGGYCDDQNLVVAGCTLPCNSVADCPQRVSALPPWICQSGVCYRPGDVYGPLASGENAMYACNQSGQVVNLCNDGVTLNGGAPPAIDCSNNKVTPGAPGEKCADTCTYQGGCTFGNVCVATASLGSGSAVVGICLKAGFQPVGASCTDHSQCKYAYCPEALGKCSRDCTADGLCPAGFSCAPTGETVSGMPVRRCQ